MSGHHFYSRDPTIPPGFYMERVLGYGPVGEGFGSAPLYRFYNGDVGDHYYNTSPAVPPGYVAEGTEGYVISLDPSRLPPGAATVSRFFHPASGDHYMNSSPAVPPGYLADGSAGAVYLTPTPGRVPLYQFYNGDAGLHFYSLDGTIRPGYGLEGIAAYVLPTGGGLGTSLLYRFYNPGNGDHYYNADPRVPAGYVAEGTEGYVLLVADESLVPKDMTKLYRFVGTGHEDHFMSTSPTPPAGYAADGTVGYVHRTAGDDRTPIYQFYEFEDEGGGFFEDVVGGIRGAADWVVGAAGTVVDIVNVVVEPILGVVGYLVELVFDIPILGRFLRWVRGVVQELVNRALAVIDIILTLFGFELRKKMRVCIVIQTDQGQPVIDRATVQAALDYAYGVYDRCNVTLIPVGGDFIKLDSGPSDARTLDVATGSDSLGRDLGFPGADINFLMRRNGYTGSGRALIGYGVPIWVIAVRSFSTPSTAGTSLGPLTDYVLVLFGRDVSTMAHEIGHSCGLLHADGGAVSTALGMSSDDPSNLMKESGPRGTGELTRKQRAYIRSSRHVSFF